MLIGNLQERTYKIDQIIVKGYNQARAIPNVILIQELAKGYFLVFYLDRYLPELCNNPVILKHKGVEE